MKECSFCRYTGDEWNVLPKKKALVLVCPVCGNAECRSTHVYHREDFDTFDDMVDYLNINEVKPEHIVTTERWTLGFTLLFFTE